MKRLILILLIVILPVAAVSAVDFGFITNQNIDLHNDADDDTVVEYTGGFIPRITTPVGENGNLYVSASFTINYNDEMILYPELLRTEYSVTSGAIGFSIGRFSYTDSMSMIANGLFDGAQIRHSSSAGRFGFGVWYSGLQYKESANITMTANDQLYYAEKLDYDNFSDTYFASRRILAAFDWSHPSIKEVLQIKTSLIGQFDVNSGTGVNKLHTEYLVLKLGIPAGRFFFEAGGILQAAQEEIGNDYETTIGFAGEVSALYRLPTSFNSSLSLSANYSGSKENEDISPFIPITTIYPGTIFQVKNSGLTVIKLNYSGRLTDSIGLGIDASYFIRNDLVTANSYPYSTDDGGYFLGSEFSGRLVWSPASDLQFILGGGIFTPSLGDNWKDEDMLWKVNLTAVLALY